MVCALVCTAQGCPIAVEVYSGNTADPATVSDLVQLLRQQFGIERIALAGDRGMLTTARIREDPGPAGLDWISALTTVDIRKLLKQPKPKKGAAETPGKPPLRPGELVEDQVAEIHSPEFPDERLLVCLNPRLRDERARKREKLLQATEEVLRHIAGMVERGTGPAKGARTRSTVAWDATRTASWCRSISRSR